VKTGGWLSGRKVLILPQSLNRSEFPGESIPVQLTRQQIKDSPDVNTDRPVSRQHEAQLGVYYGFPPLPPPPMGFGMMPGADVVYTATPVAVDLPPGAHEDPHLRSAKELKGYSLRTSGEVVGKVEDLTIDWKVMRVTSVLTVGDRVLPVDAVRRISWEDQAVEISWSPEDVRRAPTTLLP
jgi:sporulation protein YlmC with PRC-barrel domain